jgi:hypothetical protein
MVLAGNDISVTHVGQYAVWEDRVVASRGSENLETYA